MKTVLTLTMIGCLAAGLLLAQARSAADRYQEALHVEEVKGDLEKAIATYQTIVGRYGADRSITAKAQLRLGMCYEKSLWVSTPTCRSRKTIR